MSCGEISDFCKEFEKFMEFYRNLCRFCSKFVWRKSLWRKNDKYEVCFKTAKNYGSYMHYEEKFWIHMSFDVFCHPYFLTSI